MSHSRITKDHPEYEKYKNSRENFRSSIEKSINTWGDFEKVLKDTLGNYYAKPTAAGAAITISFYYAALRALIENPEEGDIKKITDKIGDLVIFRPDICGCDVVEVANAALAAEAQAVAEMVDTIRQFVATLNSDSPDDGASTSDSNKPVVH